MRKFAQLQPISSDDPYEILGLPRNTTKEDVQSTWRKMAPRHHPDTFIDEQDRRTATLNLQKINNARDVLFAELDKPQSGGLFDYFNTNFPGNTQSDKPGYPPYDPSNYYMSKKEAIRFANDIMESRYITEFSKPMHQYGKTTKDAWYIYYLFLTRFGYKRKLIEARYPNVVNSFRSFREYLTEMGTKTEKVFTVANIISVLVKDKARGMSDSEVWNDLIGELTGDY